MKEFFSSGYDHTRTLFTSRATVSVPHRIVGFVLFALFLWVLPSSGFASPEQVSTLEIPLDGNTIPKTLTFPVYEQQGIQYFSAGMGKEERSLSYPPHSVKLIFVKGPRAFLAGVTVDIYNSDGSLLVNIPSNEVQGPWLFMTMPNGNYAIKATDSQGVTLEKPLRVQGKASTVIHFRWP